MKQLEASKDMFQGNIQQFKRKAAAMHQTLVGFEHETQAMSAKITEIQRRVRKEIQQRRIDLENELKKLRKLVRSHNRADDSEPSDEDAVDMRT
jgi:septal ring factor EnvC (AmiA/AmiB activator)